MASEKSILEQYVEHLIATPDTRPECDQRQQLVFGFPTQPVPVNIPSRAISSMETRMGSGGPSTPEPELRSYDALVVVTPESQVLPPPVGGRTRAQRRVALHRCTGPSSPLAPSTLVACRVDCTAKFTEVEEKAILLIFLHLEFGAGGGGEEEEEEGGGGGGGGGERRRRRRKEEEEEERGGGGGGGGRREEEEKKEEEEEIIWSDKHEWEIIPQPKFPVAEKKKKVKIIII